MRSWFARLLIGVVIAWNLQAALAFFISPGAFAPGFELSGAAGEAAMRGVAVLFAMWNVPYLFALWYPVRNRLSFKEALIMQALGLLGETSIFWSLGAEHVLLRASILRFVLFDGSGLVLLLIGFLFTFRTLERG